MFPTFLRASWRRRILSVFLFCLSSAFASWTMPSSPGDGSDCSGNADIDFVRGMIPHHQGAIDMARIELEHGKNPELRKLAEEIIKAQEEEIRIMQDWLAKNGG